MTEGGLTLGMVVVFPEDSWMFAQPDVKGHIDIRAGTIGIVIDLNTDDASTWVTLLVNGQLCGSYDFDICNEIEAL